MPVHNHIESYRNKIDFNKYQKQIDRLINRIVHTFTQTYKGITNYKVRETFWDLVSGTIEFDPNKWYHVFASHMSQLAMIDILFKENKIDQFHNNLHNSWAEYLTILILPYEKDIPNAFFANLIQNLPVPHLENVLELYQEGVILFKVNLKKTMLDASIDPSIKILKFKANFVNLFEVFLSKCEYIDQELAKYGEILHQNRLHDIFQLKNHNERTPPELIRKVLIILNHIRNSISHASKAGIIYNEKKKKVQIKDYSAGGKQSFKENFSFNELYEQYYLLLMLIMEFEIVATFLTLHRVMLDLNQKYNKRVICNVCGYESIVFAPPKRKNLVCNKCKTRLRILYEKE